MKPPVLGLFFINSFLFEITVSVFFLVIDLFRYFISWWFSLGRCMFLGIYSLLPGYSICWCLIVHNTFLILCTFFWYQLQFLLLYFWFYLFKPSLFFLGSKAKSLSILSFQRTSSLLHWSFLFFVWAVLSFIYFLSSANFGFCLCFSS